MTSAALLRKNLLAAVQESILPSLQAGSTPRLATALFPLDLPTGFLLRELPYPPLRKKDSERIYPNGRVWPDVQMHAMKYPSLTFVIEGEADILVGVTDAMTNHLAPGEKSMALRGGYVISVPQSAMLLVPPHTPQRTGENPPWQRKAAHIGKTTLLYMRALQVGALCNFITMHDADYHAQYSLLLADNQLTTIMDVLLSEQSTPRDSPNITRALLQVLFWRVERTLQTQRPLMTDGLYSRFPDSQPTDSAGQPSHHPLIKRLHKWIRERLHQPLCPAQIATQARCSPRQLNRIFQTHTGMTTMNYVAKLRIESASLLLETSDLSVSEIASVTGFPQLPHFSRTFRRHTGHTPLQFRQMQRENTH